MASRHLTYTSQQPKQSGVYWHRRSEQERWSLVTVMLSKDEHEWLVVYSDWTSVDYLINWKGDWAGPLPTPVGYQHLEHIDKDAIENG